MPRVYGYWPGISSPRTGRSSDVYSGLTGTPEMVEVSMSSVRLVLLDSNSSRQTCFGSRALTFIWLNPLSELAQDLLRDSVRGPILAKALGQGAAVCERLPRPLPGELRHDLGGLVFQPLLGVRLRPAPRLPMLAVRLDRGPQLLDAFLPGRGSGDDRLLPCLVLALRRQRKHRPQLARDPLVPLEVRLVHHEDVSDLQDPGLDHLHAVAEVRGQHDHRRVRHRGHLQLGLADAHRLQDHRIEAERAEQPDRLAGGQRQPAQVTARAHAPDEDLGVEGVPLHLNAVA